MQSTDSDGDVQRLATMTSTGNFCGTCGRAATEGSTFCACCGRPLVEAAVPGATATPFTPSGAPPTGSILGNAALPPPPAYGAAPGYTTPPPPPPGYGMPPPGQTFYPGTPMVVTRQSTNGLSIASLVLGIVWFLGIGSILAVIFGFVSRRQIKASGGRQTGEGMALAGIILGFLGILGMILWILLVVAVARTIGNCHNEPGNLDHVTCTDTTLDNSGTTSSYSRNPGTFPNGSNSGFGANGAFGHSAGGAITFTQSTLSQ